MRLSFKPALPVPALAFVSALLAAVGSVTAKEPVFPATMSAQAVRVVSGAMQPPAYTVVSEFSLKSSGSAEFVMVPSALTDKGGGLVIGLAVSRSEGIFGAGTDIDVLAKPGLFAPGLVSDPDYALPPVWKTAQAVRLSGDAAIQPGKPYKAVLSMDSVKSEVSVSVSAKGSAKPLWQGYYPIQKGVLAGKPLYPAMAAAPASGDSTPWKATVAGVSLSGRYLRAEGPGILAGSGFGSLNPMPDGDGSGVVDDRGIACLLPGDPIAYEAPGFPVPLPGGIHPQFALNGKAVYTGETMGNPGTGGWKASFRVPAGLAPGLYEVWATYREGGFAKVLAKSRARVVVGIVDARLSLPDERPWVSGGVFKASVGVSSRGDAGALALGIDAKPYSAGDKDWKRVWTGDWGAGAGGGSIVAGFSVDGQFPMEFRLNAKAGAGVFVLTSVDVGKTEFWVSPKGKDSWSGRRPDPNGSGDGPFATIGAAAKAIRAMKERQGLPKGGVTVWLGGGTYRLDETVVLSADDSGTPDSPITYRAMPGQTPVFQGGPAVKGFRPYRNGILVADLGPQGIGPFEPWPNMSRGNGVAPGLEVISKGKRQQLARWPNAIPGDERGGAWEYVASAAEGATDRFGYSGDRPKAWKSTEGAMVNIWPDFNWHDEIVPLAGIDTGKREIILRDPTEYPIKPGRRFAVLGLLEELDAPGEWYYDHKANRLYIMPEGDIADGDIVVSSTHTAIHLDGVSNVTLAGLVIEGFRGTGVAMSSCADTVLKGSVIRNVGGVGVTIESSLRSGVRGCEIHDTGRGGITLGGGDRQTLEPGGSFAENNLIHHYGRLVKCYQAGVVISGVGNRIANNLIHDGPHNAILLSGNEHVIEYNEVHHVCMEGADSGAFYMGRDWSMQGNVIRYNHFHDIAGYGLENEQSGKGPWRYEAPHAAWAIYLDDCASGTTVFGNIFARVPLGAVMIGGGRNNTVENNIIVESSPAVHLDARWDEYPHYFTYQRDRLDDVNFMEPPYSTRYPGLAEIYDKDPRIPMDNRIAGNIMSYTDDNWRGSWNMRKGTGVAVLWEFQNYDPETFAVERNLIWHADQKVRVDVGAYMKGNSGKTFEAWQRLGFDKGSIIADPLFVDPAKDDYRLADGSPAASIGFKPIPFERIGPKPDPDNAWSAVVPDPRRDGITYSVTTVPAGK